MLGFVASNDDRAAACLDQRWMFEMPPGPTAIGPRDHTKQRSHRHEDDIKQTVGHVGSHGGIDAPAVLTAVGDDDHSLLAADDILSVDVY